MLTNQNKKTVNTFIDEHSEKEGICKGKIPTGNIKPFIEDYTQWYVETFQQDATLRELFSTLAECSRSDLFYNENKKIKYETVTEKSEVEQNGVKTLTTVTKNIPVLNIVEITFGMGADKYNEFVTNLFEREYSKTGLLTFKNELLKRNPNTLEYLKACKQIFPNVSYSNLGNAAEGLRQYIQKVYYNMYKYAGEVYKDDLEANNKMIPQVKNFDKCLYLYSPVGGTGKSQFIKRLRHFATTYGIANKTIDLQSDWSNNTAAASYIATQEEWDTFKDYNMNNFDAILDNSLYTVKEKFKPEYPEVSRCSVVIAANYIMKDKSSRRLSVIQYNDKSVCEGLTKQEKELLGYNKTDEEWDKIFYTAFITCPFDSNVVFQNKKISNVVKNSYAIDLINKLRDNISLINDLTYATPTELAYALFDVDQDKSRNMCRKDYKNDIIKTITKMVQNDKCISPVKRINNKIEYSRFDFVEISKLKTLADEDVTDDDKYKNESVIVSTSLAWDDFILDYNNENNEGEDNGKHNKENGSKSSKDREQGTVDTNTKTEIIANNEQVSNVQINVMVPKEILANKNELGTSRTSNEDSRILCSRTSKRNNTEADSILFEQKKEVLEKLMCI